MKLYFIYNLNCVKNNKEESKEMRGTRKYIIWSQKYRVNRQKDH